MRAVPAGDKVQLVGQYMTEKTGCIYDPGMYQAMAILDDDDNFQGGVVFSDFRGYDCQVSCASETPMAFRDRVCNAVFDYIFNQLGCVRCTSLTKKTNKRTRAFLEALGFKLEGRIRKGYDGVRDALIYGLLREECRFIEGFEDGPTDSEEAGQPDNFAEATASETVVTPVSKAASIPSSAGNGKVADFW